MSYYVLIGFGNVACSFFKSFCSVISGSDVIFIVLRTNNFGYKVFIDHILDIYGVKVFVFTKYKGVVCSVKGFVFELIGDNFYAKDIVLRTLLSYNILFTANKFVLYKNIGMLLPYLYKRVFFEAAIGGGIPFVKTLVTLSTSTVIKSCCAIINGTTNYLLTSMSQSCGFFDSLSKSFELGLAETKPVKDLSGFDCFNKLIILAALLRKCCFVGLVPFCVQALPLSDYLYGFLVYLGFVSKYMSVVVFKGCSFYCEVALWLFRTCTVFTITNYTYNSVVLTTKAHGLFAFIAKGAGAIVTTYSLFSDIYTYPLHLPVTVSGVRNLTALSLVYSYYVFFISLSLLVKFLWFIFIYGFCGSFFIFDGCIVFFLKLRINLFTVRRFSLVFGVNFSCYRLL